MTDKEEQCVIIQDNMDPVERRRLECLDRAIRLNPEADAFDIVQAAKRFSQFVGKG